MQLSEHKELHWLVAMASVVIILAGLKAAEAIVIPMMLAVFIGIISLPFLRLMTARGLPSGVAVLVMMGVILLFGGSLAWVVGQSVDGFMQKLPLYQSRLQGLLNELLPVLHAWNLPLDLDQLVEQIKPAQIMGAMGQVLSTISNLLTNIFLVLFIVIFLLLEEASLPQKLKEAGITLRHASAFAQKTHRYLLIKTLVSLATGLLVTLWLSIQGVDFPVLWGLIAMLMNFIPNVGSLIAAVPAIVLALIQLGIGDAALVALGYLVINTLMGNVVEPRYMGKGLGLSPLVVFLSLIIWGWLFGPVGMFLSIPLTMIVKIALEQYVNTRWLAIMLSDR